MPQDSGAMHLKPSTRTSIRHSLNLASVGKALGEIMSKDGDKALKKTRELNARRSTTTHNNTPGPSRHSIDTLRPSPPKKLDDPILTRSRARRLSVVPLKPPIELDSTRPSSSSTTTTKSYLRPRTSSSTSSALPKYRPKSVFVDSTRKPPSPFRAGTRRPLSNSDDEREPTRRHSKDTPTRATPQSSAEKMARAISPLPHRTTFKVNIAAINLRRPSTPPNPKSQSPPTKISPGRPVKLVKTAAGSITQSAIPRPPSSTSSSSPQHTPRSSVKNTLAATGKSSRDNAYREPNSRRFLSESPLAHRPQKVVKVTKGSSSHTKSPFVGNMSHISEGDSTDDVAMLLAPFASLSAPTPAMPRSSSSSHAPRNQSTFKTPPRPSNPRTNRPHLSLTPPDFDDSPTIRDKSRARGSILSWEQLASEGSRTLGEGEIESMLSDIPAPFVPDITSPSPKARSIGSAPDSPCLTGMHSPGGYGSISQILLPDVTPSPALHHHASRYDNVPTELPAVDAAIVTLLRLQLASAEEVAKERSSRLQALEEEMHNLKETRTREIKELENQVSHMEEQLRMNIETRDKAEEERAAYTMALEDQISHDHASLDQAVRDAVEKANSTAQLAQEAALQSERRKWQAACSARGASAAWSSVRDLAQGDLELVRMGMEILTGLLAGLECHRAGTNLCK